MIRFLHSKVFTVVGLSLFCVVIFLPPIIYDYIYPNVGDDAAMHLAILDAIKMGKYADGNISLILSYRLVGYPIVWLSKMFGVSVDVLFLWFSYVSLAFIGLVVYFVMSRLVGRKSGWLSLAVVLFGAQGILFQFYFGQIFNAINMGLILPLLLFFSIRYLSQGKFVQLMLALLLGVLFGAFHASGIYLPFVAAFALGCHILYRLLQRKRIAHRSIYLGIGVILLSLVGFLLSIPNTKELWQVALYAERQGRGIPIGEYFMGIVSPTVLILMVFTLINLRDIWKAMSPNVKSLVVILSCFVVTLSVASFTTLSLDPFRQALDLATLLALLVAVLIGSVVWTRKNQMAVVIVLLAVAFGLWHTLPPWFTYNSAISPADKDAIAYVNTLNRGSYNASSEVAPWIYDRFMVLAKYEESPNKDGDVAPILIVRDKPMTPRSDDMNKWYEGHGFDIEDYIPLYGNDSFDDDYTLLRAFGDGKVTVRIYENIGNAYYLPLGVKQ